MTEATSRSWTLLSVDGPRQHGGNAGYDDAPASTYRFDSGVANSRNVRAGDIAFIRDGEGLLGIALIERVDRRQGDKELLKCPVCGLSKIRERRSMSPTYRCHTGHEFEAPLRERVPVTLYEAHYGSTFIKVSAGISGVGLRSAAFRPNPQMSIEEVDAARLADRIVSAEPGTRTLLEQFLQRRFFDRREGEIGSDTAGGDGYTLQMSDRREKITASICARRGQPKFRRDLRKRYGDVCAISGCTVMDIVEAAHIWPYRGPEDNHSGNGLLLRADLHTLYYLDLIGIDEQMQVHVSSELRGSEYESLQGKLLIVAALPSAAAIRERWQLFTQKRCLTSLSRRKMRETSLPRCEVSPR